MTKEQLPENHPQTSMPESAVEMPNVPEERTLLTELVHDYLFTDMTVEEFESRELYAIGSLNRSPVPQHDFYKES